MAPKVDRERATNAVKAAKDLGIGKQKAQTVLKKLIKLYDHNWELIEADNYQTFIDALLDDNDEDLPVSRSPGEASNKRKDHFSGDSSDGYRKKLRVQNDEQHTSPLSPVLAKHFVAAGTSLRSPKVETEALHSDIEHPEEVEGQSLIHYDRKKKLMETPGESLKDKSPMPNSLHSPTTMCLAPAPPIAVQTSLDQDEDCMQEDSGGLTSNRKRKAYTVEENILEGLRNDPDCLRSNRQRRTYPLEENILPGLRNDPVQHCSRLIKPKSEPVDSCYPVFEIPLAICAPPPTPAAFGDQGDPSFRMRSSMENSVPDVANAPTLKQTLVNRNEVNVQQDFPLKPCSDILGVPEESSSNQFEIASSVGGNVKVALTCTSDMPGFNMPNLEDLLRMVESKCLRSYKILDPGFSLMNIMKEICQSAVELGSESPSKSISVQHENIINVIPLLDSLKKSSVSSALGGTSTSFLPSHSPFNEVIRQEDMEAIPNKPLLTENVCAVHENGEKKKKPFLPSQGPCDAQAAVKKQQLALCTVKPRHDVNDISKGEEKIRISLENENGEYNEKYPSSFFYIPQNIVYQNAYVNVSLARIGDEDCCADCFGDCLAAPFPCACARETGGEYAYTQDELVKKQFLDECISMSNDDRKDRLFYCKECPLERSKNDGHRDSCKGHLIRKFIKECWSKCGCNKQCGNRVVQRGIKCNLQVFYTEEGKGWGLRTLEDLPRGTFVCEYVGEVLTNLELYDRNKNITGNAKHTYPVLLDADWGSEGILKDEEALCLDATFYGNVARFVNHRCCDANMIEIPVEVEIPDHHYYHLAFFTTRNVEAFEELTWDYGIDFDDRSHPVKAFRCCCKSKLCRDSKRTRSRSGR